MRPGLRVHDGQRPDPRALSPESRRGLLEAETMQRVARLADAEIADGKRRGLTRAAIVARISKQLGKVLQAPIGAGVKFRNVPAAPTTIDAAAIYAARNNKEPRR